MKPHCLPPDCHTVKRLEHATPEHLHLTTRRHFIGPIPEGWLKSHRKQWYKEHVLGYKSRTPSFRAAHRYTFHDPATPEQPLPDEPPEALRNTSTQSSGNALLQDSVSSTTSLLHSQRVSEAEAASPQPAPRRNVDDQAPRPETSGQDEHPPEVASQVSKPITPKVRFNEASRLQLRARAQRLAAKGNLRSSKIKEGEMLKAEKMLVRIDITQQSLREGFDEKLGQGVETRRLDKWREFMVVCRKHSEEDAQAVLQLYQTRVIATTDAGMVKKKPKEQLVMSSRLVKVNLYSALDKMLCIWTTHNMRTTIYYLRAQTGASAVEWLSFLRGLLGLGRKEMLQVNIPDLNVSLRLEDPFRMLEESQALQDAADGDDAAIERAAAEERGAADRIISRCVEMVGQSTQWADVLKLWTAEDRIGLAWRRYDRLEWVHGISQQRMYGTIAMQRTHDLELRLKDHYPLSTKLANGKTVPEPVPIEGFLIRLTSQKGRERHLGKMLFKRLYFTSHNQYLLFLRPAKADPPSPPRMPSHPSDNLPSAREISDKVPLTFNVEPYALDGKRIAWLDTEGVKPPREVRAHDAAAAAEADRNLQAILACDGFINLCDVKKIRKFHKGALAADETLDDGSDVDFHAPVPDTPYNDGTATELDEDRVFELVMTNGLIIRLQAFNRFTRDIWLHRMRQLVKYWSRRIKEDMQLYRATRAQNLHELGIDEGTEAHIGQFASKWEVGKSFASPILYNICGLARCRALHTSGVLFRKPRRHTTFTRCHVLLAHGHLLIFQDILRARNGKRLAHAHHERIAAISLAGCYLYSGLLTENELLYQNQTFDSNAPGRHALPRVYLEDGWTSTDEDAMTTFVIWHAKSKSWFKKSEFVDDVRTHEDGQGDPRKARTTLTRVSQLGATGRNVVFMARSRAERDHWVLAIQTEIERLAAAAEEIRLVDGGDAK